MDGDGQQHQLLVVNGSSDHQQDYQQHSDHSNDSVVVVGVDGQFPKPDQLTNNHVKSMDSDDSSQSTPSTSLSTGPSPDRQLVTACREPDPDALKMFVGQIPRDWSEADCRRLMQQFGEVHSINVLRDKRTGRSRGCCFVTFVTRRSALEAQNVLHNVRTLPGPKNRNRVRQRLDHLGGEDDDLLTKQAKELIVAAAASVLLNRQQHPQPPTVAGSPLTTTPTVVGQHPMSCVAVGCHCHDGLIRGALCHHPIQMKPADTENRNDRKLFVGMLAKSMNEPDVRAMFSPFGVIEECTILKDVNGQSKGCAFVTYSTRSSASAAIKALHQSATLETCTSPLVVKFADTQKDKEARRSVGSQSLVHQLWPTAAAAAGSIPSLISNQYLLAALTQQQQLAAAAQLSGHLQATPTAYLTGQLSNQDLSLATALANPVLMAALTGNGASPVKTTVNSGHTVSVSPSLAAAYQTYQQNKALDSMAAVSHGHSVRDHLSLATTGQLSSYLTLPQLAAAAPTAITGLTSASMSSAGSQKQQEGPDGANLFIYHLPPEFTDSDLISTFSPFGTVISAKVFIDKVTNLSKCFGFVSYTSPVSAQAAIQAMHGFQIRNKRLKVQLKKARDKPY